MSAFRLILKSLLYYWKTNLAVLMGVVAGASVIGGALVVGDSVRESLRQLSLKRLGEVDYALESPRFFREKLAGEIESRVDHEMTVAPGLSLTASLQFVEDNEDEDRPNKTHLANQVGLWGLDERLWTMIAPKEIPAPVDREIVLSLQTARSLKAEIGDEISLFVELPATIPRGSLLGEREKISQELVFTVSHILDGGTTADRFQLNPSQKLTLNAYVSLEELQISLELAASRPTPDDPRGKPARVNAVFVNAGGQHSQDLAAANELNRQLNGELKQSLNFDDLFLKLRTVEDRSYVTLESHQMILDPSMEQAAKKASKEIEASASPVLVYLANEFANQSDPEKYSLYSVIAGVDRRTLDNSPFGPPPLISGTWPDEMEDDQIVVNSWLAKELEVSPGDRITVKWHVVGSHGELPEIEHEFQVVGIVDLTGPVDDLGLTPQLKGITDVDTYDEWDKPFEMELDRLTQSDEDYWEGTEESKAYRATPKAFVSLNTAQQLWHSRYGNLTSYRFAPKSSETDLSEFRQRVTKAFLNSYEPENAGLAFRPVKTLGLQAAQGTTDFSALFIAFSFFLIISAMILIGLLFRLGIERRLFELGLLHSVGWTDSMVKRHIITESLLVILVGTGVGAYASIRYADTMIHALATRWVGAIGTNELSLSLQPLSLGIGSAISIAVALGAVVWSLRQFKSLSFRSMLSGTQSESPIGTSSSKTRYWAMGTGLLAVLLLVLTVLGAVPEIEVFAGLSVKVVIFFVVGMLSLACSLLTLSVWISRDKELAIQGTGQAALARLSVRNASRNRSRTVLTTGLISSATFVIAAVAAGQKNPDAEGPELVSGNGGFRLVAESSQPILPDLNSATGREEALEFLNQSDSEVSAEIQKVLSEIDIVPFRRKPGEDASCLNPYQTTLPTVLGATSRMQERGGFTFSGVSTSEPWSLLSKDIADDQQALPVYPVFGDLNTLQYSLHKTIGDRIAVPNEENPRAWLEIVGAFTGSIFQGVLVSSEENFLTLFPEEEGYSWFLIGGSPGDIQEFTRQDAETVGEYLETGLNQYGFDVNRVQERLDAFLTVQNTYLKTFQTLGGLGLLLGTIGLGTVMLRNVMERGGEISLLRAVGFRNRQVTRLIILENAFLLTWGLLSGTGAALLAMLPHLLSVGADVPWNSLVSLLVGVFLTGMIASLAAVIQAVKTPVLANLRGD